jgi:hypothetical protein
VRLQASGPGSSSQIAYKGTIDCIVRTYRVEGFTALFRGMQVPLSMLPVTQALLFGTNASAIRSIKRLKGQSASVPLAWHEMALAGSISGFVLSFVHCPVELVKQRRQMEVIAISTARPDQTIIPKQQITYKSNMDVVRRAIHEEGFRSLWTGLHATIYRNVPAIAAWFTSFDVLRRWFTNDGKDMHPLRVMAAGSAAGCIFWVFAYPQDFAKSRLQTHYQFKDGPLMPKPTLTGIIARAIREEGWRSFMRGFWPCMARAIPGSATTFTVYSYVSDALESI